MSAEQEKDALESIELAKMKMSPEAARRITEYITSLQHYRDSTVGLWVVDKPNKVAPDKLMFQLKFK